MLDHCMPVLLAGVLLIVVELLQTMLRLCSVLSQADPEEIIASYLEGQSFQYIKQNF